MNFLPIEKRTPQLAAELRKANPNYSYCGKCGFPWNHCEARSVMHSKTTGTFATCKQCWENSSIDELKAYYTATYHRQSSSTPIPMKHTLQHLLKCVEIEKKKQPCS